MRSEKNNLPGLVRQAACELDLPIDRFLLPGALFDHMPFAEEGYDTVSIIGFGKGSWSIQTTGDVHEKLHEQGFEQAGLLAVKMIEHLCGA